MYVTDRSNNTQSTAVHTFGQPKMNMVNSDVLRFEFVVSFMINSYWNIPSFSYCFGRHTEISTEQRPGFVTIQIRPYDTMTQVWLPDQVF